MDRNTLTLTPKQKDFAVEVNKAGSTPVALKFSSPYIAVFNSHVNDAKEKAMKATRRKFRGVKDVPGLQALEHYYKSGIMAIFDHKPTGPSTEFVTRCFALTNGIPLREARARFAAVVLSTLTK